MCLEVFARVWRFSNVFGCVRMHSSIFGNFGNFRNVTDVYIRLSKWFLLNVLLVKSTRRRRR